jgi:hypothetical protein
MKKWAKKQNRAFPKEEVQMSSLAIKEMQIKTTLGFISLLLEWLPSRIQTRSVGEDVGEKEPYTAGGNVNYKPTL